MLIQVLVLAHIDTSPLEDGLELLRRVLEAPLRVKYEFLDLTSARGVRLPS